MRKRLLPRGLLAAALVAVCSVAGAASLQVAPIGLEFLPSDSAQGLWLTNTGGDRLRAQVRVFQWSQVDGEDVLTPTQALAASPPMLSLEPSAQQLVRVVRLDTPGPSGGEQAYRLLVDELPQPDSAKQSGVRYVLRYSIPVFVAPAPPPDAATVAETLHWSLVQDGDGIALQARNSGAFHAQLSQVSLLPPGGTSIELTAGLLGYVLPGKTRRWPLKQTTAQLPPGTRLKVSINGKAVDQTFAIDALPR